MSDDRYERVTFRGHTVDRYTMAALLEMERRLGYELTVLQGSYNAGGVGASAGTHDGGGAVDLAPFEADRKVKVAREVGFAAWHRLPSQGPWSEHVHMILIGDQKMSAAAAAQVVDYRNGRNGLANHLSDPMPRPNPIPVFNYQGTPPPKSKAARVDGADISHYQSGALDFKAAKAAGLLFVYHKCTEGMSVTDDRYKARRVEVNAAGLRWGAYHFARPKSGSGATQATRFLAAAALKPGDMVPMLDLEDDGGLTKTQLTRWVGDFVKVVKDKTGQLPIIYTPFGLDETFGCRLWVARYNNDMRAPNVPEPWNKQRPLLRKKWTIWQFSNGALGAPDSVAGLGHVDLDTLGGLKATRGLRLRRLVLKKPVTPDPTPAPAPKPTPKPPTAKPQRVVVAAYNGQFGHPLPVKRIDIAELESAEYTRNGVTSPGADADVVDLSEWGSYGAVKPASDHVRYKGEGKPGQPSTPCDYRPAIFAPGTVRTVSTLLSGPAKVPTSIPGPADTKPKYANQVAGVLKDARMPVRFIPYHGNVRPNSSKATKALRKEQVDALVKIIEAAHQRGETVILAGDFNCAGDDKATAGPLKAAGLRLVAVSKLMHVWVTGKPAKGSVRIVSKRTITHTDADSDHDVPVVEFEFTPI